MRGKHCESCVFSGVLSGNDIHCNYSATGKTCLHMVNGKVEDIRGKDKSRCNLYVKGARKDKKRGTLIYGLESV